MNRFKKRTIALVLASVVSVVGAFGTNNYRNTVMNISFDNATSGSLNMVVHTRAPFSGTLKPIKKDANTYVLMLPELNSEAPTPNLEGALGNVQSVNIRTMPYSANSNGYTRITIKTNNPAITLNASSKIYVATQKTALIEDKLKSQTTMSSNRRSESSSVSTNNQSAIQERQRQERIEQQRAQREAELAVQARMARERAMQQQTLAQAQKVTNTEQTDNQTIILKTKPSDMEAKPSNPYTEKTLLILGSLLILFVTIFFALRAKDKIRELAGESINIELDGEPKKIKPEKKKEKKQNKKVIKKQASPYKEMGVATPSVPATPVKTAKPAEELNVVDLDELFQEHKSKKQESLSKEDEENNALEDFLSGFSFDEEFGVENEEEIDENAELRNEYYEQLINSKDVVFSNADIECMKQLINLEINDDTIRNIDKYAISNPIAKKPSKKEILEDLVTTYAISQHISFTSEDIAIINKLISIEIDNDFLSDIRTNPDKVMKMEKDILDFGEKPKKPSEIVTLSVKDMLPDLSDALKKQGGKKIESNGRAETVYFSEGYEVKKLKFSDVLPDLAAEINKPSAYDSNPSADYELVDNSYVVDKLNISNSLPDLTDMLANPEKYSKPKAEKAIADENALLKNITNVEFKPFYDGSQEFEVLNEIPSVDEIQQEFSQFDNFEIHHDDYDDKPVVENDYDDFESLYNEEYLDLDSKEISEEVAAFFEDRQTIYQGPTVTYSEDENKEEIAEKDDDGISNNSFESDLLESMELDLSKDSETIEDIELLTISNEENVPTIEPETISSNDTKEETTEETVQDELAQETSIEPIKQQESIPQEDIIDTPYNSIQTTKKSVNNKRDFVPLKLERNISQTTQKRETTGATKDLMEKIEQTKLEREKIKARLARAANQKTTNKPERKVTITSTKCIVDGINYNIISSVNLTHNTGCYLVKNNDEYAVIGFVGRKMSKLVSYDSLKSEKIQARVNERISDTEAQYIIRIGLNKFLVKADDNNIEFIMNLC